MANRQLKFRFEKAGDNVHKLFVYDAVRADGKFNWSTWEYEESETSAKYFRDRLNEIPTGDTIELHVNSNGGEVSEGVAIYNMLRQKAKAGSKIVGYVDGVAYSIAMTIVMACDEIHMGLGTSMFLHNPWTIATGNAQELRNVADQLDVLAASSRQLYLDRAKGLSEQELMEMMDAETMLDPDTCLNYGFCDFVGEADPEDEPVPEEDPEDKDSQIRQLKQRLFTQTQLAELVKGLQAANRQEPPKQEKPIKPSIKETLKAAFAQRN